MRGQDKRAKNLMYERSGLSGHGSTELVGEPWHIRSLTNDRLSLPVRHVAASNPRQAGDIGQPRFGLIAHLIRDPAPDLRFRPSPGNLSWCRFPRRPPSLAVEGRLQHMASDSDQIQPYEPILCVIRLGARDFRRQSRKKALLTKPDGLRSCP